MVRPLWAALCACASSWSLKACSGFFTCLAVNMLEHHNGGHTMACLKVTLAIRYTCSEARRRGVQRGQLYSDCEQAINDRHRLTNFGLLARRKVQPPG